MGCGLRAEEKLVQVVRGKRLKTRMEDGIQYVQRATCKNDEVFIQVSDSDSEAISLLAGLFLPSGLCLSAQALILMLMNVLYQRSIHVWSIG